MHHHHTRLKRPAALLCMALLAACSSTPQHTNTLIFGTTTRVALDVSQEATGAMGVTLGYKRQEAVWMPLLANQAASAAGDMKPADCAPGSGKDTATHCPKFVGTAGSSSSNGAGAQDTYSVLATFSGDIGGGASGAASAPEAKTYANAKMAQFFATGLAARLLAEKGGAGLVVAGAEPAAQSDANAKAAGLAAVANAESVKAAAVQSSRASSIAIKVSNTDDSINSDRMKKLLDAAPSAAIKPSTKAHIRSYKGRQELESYLSDAHPNVVSALWQSLDTL